MGPYSNHPSQPIPNAAYPDSSYQPSSSSPSALNPPLGIASPISPTMATPFLSQPASPAWPPKGPPPPYNPSQTPSLDGPSSSRSPNPYSSAGNDPAKLGPVALRRRKRKLAICIVLLCTILLFLIALIVGIAMGVLRGHVNDDNNSGGHDRNQDQSHGKLD